MSDGISIASSLSYSKVPAMVGLITVLVVGILGCVAIILACLWLVVTLGLTVLQAVIEVLTSIGATYTAADPSIKLLVLCAIAYTLYRFHHQRAARKEAH